MARHVRTDPLPAIIVAEQNHPWTVAGALHELIDNSFGPGRGSASTVRITWDQTRRVLDVLDDGVGMDDVSRLAQLGNTIGYAPQDIGRFGAGGTKALIWLANRVSVWTLRRGKVARFTIDWNQAVRSGAFPEIDIDWYAATSKNAPAELRERGTGTLIRLHLPAKRRVWTSNVRRDLARYWGHAARNGKRVIWKTISRGKVTEEIQLGELVALADPVTLNVAIKHEGAVLTATGKAAVVPDLTIANSSIAICFPPRVLTFTKDCYRSPDTEKVFDGIGVTGYVDLGDGWQPYLTTTKTGIDDDRLWDLLMVALFAQLRPLLERTERERMHVLIDDLGLDLEKVFDRKLNVTVYGDDQVERNPEGEDRTGRKRNGRESEHDPSEPATKEERETPGAVKLELTHASDDEMNQTLCRVDVVRDSIGVYVNKDHEFVQEAIKARPPNRHALHMMILTELALRIVQERSDLLPKMFPRRVVEDIETRETLVQVAYVTRLLLDRVAA